MKLNISSSCYKADRFQIKLVLKYLLASGIRVSVGIINYIATNL